MLTLLSLVGAVTSCSDGGTDDEAFCDDAPAPEVTGEVTAHRRSDLVFVEGDGTASAADGPVPHVHDGPLVADGEPHLHYCVALTSGFPDPLVIQAVQVLPGQREEPLATIESGALVDSVRGGADVRLDAHETVELELLIPAAEPHGELRHRIAFTVEGPDGPRDLFSESAITGEG